MPDKTCRRCLLPLPTEEFTAHPKGRNGLHPWCRSCLYLYRQARYTPVERDPVTKKPVR